MAACSSSLAGSAHGCKTLQVSFPPIGGAGHAPGSERDNPRNSTFGHLLGITVEDHGQRDGGVVVTPQVPLLLGRVVGCGVTFSTKAAPVA